MSFSNKRTDSSKETTVFLPYLDILSICIQELKKMNQYLSSENRDLEDKNEVFKKMAERLIKISNEIVIPKSDKDQNNFSNKFHKIFSPIKDKIK